MPPVYTPPDHGKLTQAALNPAKAGTVDFFFAPPFTPFDAPSGVNGGWIYAGRIDPGSYKNKFERKFIDVRTGLPMTLKESFVNEIDGRLDAVFIEPTGKLFEIANGGDPAVPMFAQPGLSTTIASLTEPPAPPTVTAAATGGTIGAGTYLVCYTYQNANGETKRSPETPITLSGTTNTLTVSGGALPFGATAIRVYVTAAGGGSGSETLQGSYNGTQTSLAITTIAAGAALPSSNTTGAASTQDTLLVSSAAGLITTPPDNIEVITPNGKEYTYVQGVYGNAVTVFPRLSAAPANGATVKRVDGWEDPLGTATINWLAVRTVMHMQDNSQIVCWAPKVRSLGVSDEQPSNKYWTMPIGFEAAGFTDASGNYNGPIVGKKFTLTPALALSYT